MISLNDNVRFRLKNPQYFHDGIVITTLKQCIDKALEVFGKEMVLAIVMDVFKDWEKYIHSQPKQESKLSSWLTKFTG